MEERNNGNRIEQEGLKIDLYTMIRDILKNLPAIIMLTLAVAMLMYIRADQGYEPIYRIEATYVVNTRGLNNDVIDNLSTTIDVANRLSEVLNSSTLRNKVAEDLGMSSFDGNVTSSVVDNTNLLTIRVTSSTPRNAYLILDSVMRNFSSISDVVVGDATLKVMTEPVIPTAPINSFSPKRQIAKSVLVTGMLLVILCGVISYFKDTIRKPEDIEGKLDTKLVGVIGHERKYRTVQSFLTRKQFSLLITSPTISFRYAEMFQKASWKVIHRMDKQNAKVLMVSSCLENEGKSTVASNLALAMAQNNKKVVLVDLDLRNPSIYKILGKGEESFEALGDTLSGIILPQGENLITELKKTGLYTVLNSETFYWSTEMTSSGKMKRIIDYLKEHFDYVILDTPPMDLVADAEEVVNLADASLLVVREHTAIARKVNDVLDALNTTKAQCIGCIFNDAHNGNGSGVPGLGSYGYGYGYGSRYYEKYYGSKD